MKRRHIADVAQLPRKTDRHSVADPELIGLHFRVPARKSKAPVSFAVIVNKKWITIGTSDALTLEEAREKAKRLRSGRSAGATVATASREWVKRKLKGKRTAKERERIVEKNILPAIGQLVMADVRLEDIKAMLDPIEDHSGAPMRDQVLRVFGAIARWHQAEETGYVAPVTRGMWRVTKRDRDRILSDDEIRMIWNADGGVFGAMVRFALLCAQRREKIRQLRWGDLKDDTWVIRREHGEKGTPPQLKLPQLALDVLASQPRVGDFVFRSRSYGPIGTSGFHKAEFDKVCAVREWRFHDLRRTARSLMPRAGVAPHTAERILGHSLRGVEGVYDRHAYVDEMADALEKLAGLVERIVNFGS
jgi:integrase